MLEWVIGACEGAGIEKLCIIKGFMSEMIDEYLNGRYETVLQEERLGTGHASYAGCAVYGGKRR